MKTFDRIHCAYNAVTGEVLTTNHANHLKRWVRRINHWNALHGYPVGAWVFAHGKDWQSLLSAKLGA